jgi:hypothetical protein
MDGSKSGRYTPHSCGQSAASRSITAGAIASMSRAGSESDAPPTLHWQGKYPVRMLCVQLNRELQHLGRPERDFLACFDLDRFSGCGIAPHASCALSNLQDAKTRNTDSFALLEMLGDKAD